MPYILVFGDSIVYGAWDKNGGWTQILREWIDEKNLEWNEDFYYLVYNLGVFGDTTEDLLERFDSEVKQRQGEEKFIFIFAVGINDSEYIHSKKGLNIPEEKFQKNLVNLIKKAKKYSSTILFVGPNPVDESKVNPMPWASDKSYINKNVERYNKLIKKTCKENIVHFIEVFSEFRKTDYRAFLEDGAHPNTKGHRLIYRIVRKYLKKNNVL